MYDWLENVTLRYHAYHGVPISDTGDLTTRIPNLKIFQKKTKISQQLRPVRDFFLQFCYHTKAGSQIALPSDSIADSIASEVNPLSATSSSFSSCLSSSDCCRSTPPQT